VLAFAGTVVATPAKAAALSATAAANDFSMFISPKKIGLEGLPQDNYAE